MNLDDGSTSWVRGCRDKARFFTVSEAKKVAKRIGRMNGRKMWAYACPHCESAHVSSRPPDRLRTDTGS